ncbi:MAG: DMT family protein, partial [Planctomycetaceae bacterium]|nr:DMT family protein [Planctomycetaceae bacterium]
VLLTCSNVFMTIAWYGHLKNFHGRPWWIAALVSWGIALAEYLIQVPANRIGHEVMNVGQLKILQEIITLSVFFPFAWLYLKEKPSMDFLYAGLCLLGAAFFVFRRHLMAG